LEGFEEEEINPTKNFVVKSRPIYSPLPYTRVLMTQMAFGAHTKGKDGK